MIIFLMFAEGYVIQVAVHMFVFAFNDGNAFFDLPVCRQADYRQGIRGQDIRQVSKRIVSKIKDKNAGQ
mgnify:CR=1 FL=1